MWRLSRRVLMALTGPAVLADAKRFPAVRLVFGTGVAPSNVTMLALEPSGTQSTVADALRAAVG